METKSSKVEHIKEKRKMAMTKETTKSLMELKDLPVEVLAKIFNFLPNHDIRCRVSLVCKQFYEICQNQSLVPVKELSIHGHNVNLRLKGKNRNALRNITAVYDLIGQSKNLTSLKIKGLHYGPLRNLVSFALQACPKLIHLEIVETSIMYGSRYFSNESYWGE